MKKLSLSLILLSTLSLAASWNIDDTHSTARFKIKHLMISNVSGEITGFKGTVDIDDKGKLTAATTTLDAKTINTQNQKRDDHLRGADFLDVTNHPTITFKSTKITQKGKTYTIAGDMTLHGVTKPVTFTDGDLTAAIKDPWGNNRRGLSAHTKISRKDFGLVWNKTLEAGGVAVGDEVDIQVELEITAPKTESKG